MTPQVLPRQHFARYRRPNGADYSAEAPVDAFDDYDDYENHDVTDSYDDDSYGR